MKISKHFQDEIKTVIERIFHIGCSQGRRDYEFREDIVIKSAVDDIVKILKKLKKPRNKKMKDKTNDQTI